MKRITLISLICLICLGTMSACGQKKEKEPVKPLNVIYMIGDGMALPQVYAALLASGESMTFTEFPYIGVVDTRSASNDITDSAAGGTALASDHRTSNAMLGVNPDSIPVMTVLEAMKAHGKKTGIVVTSYVTHATPAAFYAKVPHRKQYEDIAMQLAETDNVDLIIGGGRKHFNQRKDSLDLIDRMENELGWTVYADLNEVNDTCKKYVVLADDNHMPKAAERGDFLPRAIKTALRTLDTTATNGFFLMVEGSQIDFACHANDSLWMMDEMMDFDYAVKVALDYAKKKGNTLVVVTADHETGGLTLPDPKGKYSDVVFDYSTSSHTCLPVLVYAYGPGAERFTGWMQNKDLKGKIMDACGLENLSDSIVDNTKPYKIVRINHDSNSNN